MTQNDLSEFDIVMNEQPQQQQVQQQELPQQVQQYEQPLESQQLKLYDTPIYKPQFISTVTDWFNNNQQLLKYIGIAIVVLLILIVIVKMISKNKENFIFETPNGPMSQETVVKPGKGAVSITRYGDQEYTQQVEPSGADMSILFQNDASVAAINSNQQADIMLKKELYNGMKQQDETDTSGNLQETGELQMIQYQNNDLQVEQDRNLNNNKLITDLNLSRQMIVQKQMPLQDVNELQQANRDVQVQRDHSSMIQSARGAGVFMSPNDPNEIIKSRQRYTINSNRPSKDNVYGPMEEKIKEQIEYKSNFDNQKEAAVKLSGPQIKLPDMKSVENNMQTTPITKEPVVQTDKQKVILSQTVIESPNVQGQKVVEKTVNPEIIAKVEEKYQRWPASLITRQQKEAAGQFMTILVLLRYSGQQIPSFDVLAQKFPEIQKMKQAGMFKGFDRDIVKWAEQQIESVKKGEKKLDDTIAQFKVMYGVDPVQSTVVGDKNQDGTVQKTSTSLQTTPSSQKGTESYTQSNGKRKFIVKQERYVIQPGHGIKGRQTIKSVFLV